MSEETLEGIANEIAMKISDDDMPFIRDINSVLQFLGTEMQRHNLELNSIQEMRARELKTLSDFLRSKYEINFMSGEWNLDAASGVLRKVNNDK
jgi:hypothetical protein